MTPSLRHAVSATLLATGGILTFAQKETALPPVASQPPPATEIYLAPFTEGKGKTVQIAIVSIQKEGVSVGKPINITNNPDYDNQPFFLPDSSGLLFSSKRDGQQNDIYRYDIAKKTVTQLTHTPENEYSPTVTPDGRTFSTVRGDEQRLWRFNLDGSDAGLAYAHKGKIGYHAWISPNQIAAYILGVDRGANTLEFCDLPSGVTATVASSIGRSLHMRPGHTTLTYVDKSQKDVWLIKEIDPATRKTETLNATVDGSEDFAWTPAGSIVMGAKSKLYFWNERNDDRWIEIGDLAKSGITAITRVAISPDSKWIAIVSQPQPAAK